MPRIVSKIQEQAARVAKLVRRPRNKVEQTDGRQPSLDAPTVVDEASASAELRLAESEELTSTASHLPVDTPSNGPAQVTTVVQTPVDLWDKAFEALRTRDGKLVNAYEKCLSEDIADSTVEASDTALASSKPNRKEELSNYIKHRIRIDEESAWKVKLGSKTIVLRAQFDTAVKIIAFAKDFVTGAISADPHASLAWSGVCLLLPVSFRLFLGR
jgi:N-terminal domain of NWD NACHT-NTPase